MRHQASDDASALRACPFQYGRGGSEAEPTVHSCFQLWTVDCLAIIPGPAVSGPREASAAVRSIFREDFIQWFGRRRRFHNTCDEDPLGVDLVAV